MEILPIDVSERLYEKYSVTLMDPGPLTGEMRDCSSNFRATYEKGIVITREQLYLIWGAHKKNADLSEPYDVGVLNALALAMDICCDRDPVFTEKPESRRSVIEACDEACDEAIETLKEWQKAEKKICSEKLAAMATAHKTEIDRLKKEIGDLKSQLSVIDLTEEVSEDDKS